MAGRRHLPLRPDQDPRAGLLDRHAAADGQRHAARRPRLLLHPHRRDRPLPADARPRGLLPDGLGRQRAADRAPGADYLRRPVRPVAALRPRLHPAGEAGPKKQVPVSRRNFVELCERWSEETEEAYESLWRRLGLSVDWTQKYTTISPVSIAAAQRAFLRNLARGEAYQAEAPGLWDVTFQTAVAQAELEAREYPGHFHRIAFHATAAGPVFIETTRPELIPAVRGAGRAPRRRALPAAVRHDGALAAVRRGGPGARAPPAPSPTRAPASRWSARSAT